MATHLKPGSSLYFFGKGEIASCGYCGQYAYVLIEEPVKGFKVTSVSLYCLHCYLRFYK